MDDVVTLKMPFRFGGRFFKEKDVDFIFRIGTMEDACDYYLKCRFEEIKDRDPGDVHMALLFAGYIFACQRQYRKPKYNFNHAVFWVTNMNTDSKAKFVKAMEELTGRAKEKFGSKDVEKKK